MTQRHAGDAVASATEELRKYRHGLKVMTGGFTISGGEPLMQHRFAVKLFAAAKAMGIHTALDTNGYFGDRSPTPSSRHRSRAARHQGVGSASGTRQLTGMDIGPTLAFARRLAAQAADLGPLRARAGPDRRPRATSRRSPSSRPGSATSSASRCCRSIRWAGSSGASSASAITSRTRSRRRPTSSSRPARCSARRDSRRSSGRDLQRRLAEMSTRSRRSDSQSGSGALFRGCPLHHRRVTYPFFRPARAASSASTFDVGGEPATEVDGTAGDVSAWRLVTVSIATTTSSCRLLLQTAAAVFACALLASAAHAQATKPPTAMPARRPARIATRASTSAGRRRGWLTWSSIRRSIPRPSRRLLHAEPARDVQAEDVAFIYGSKWKQRYFTKRGDDYFVAPRAVGRARKDVAPLLRRAGTDWWAEHYPADRCSGRRVRSATAATRSTTTSQTKTVDRVECRLREVPRPGQPRTSRIRRLRTS